MNTRKLICLVATAVFSLSACSQTDDSQSKKAVPDEPAVKQEKQRQLHAYGGWYCPDNLGGFPPMNVQMLDKLEVVEGRLPTREETRNGRSLMYIDTSKSPDAMAPAIDLPRLACYFNDYSDKKELVIIIQAVTAGPDTVVGFRYVDGGNGSSWYDEVTFLTDEEVVDVGATPFVFFTAEIDAPKEKVWEAVTKTSYARQLGERFDQQAFFASPWQANSRVRLDYETIGEKATGSASLHFGNIYMQIHYTYRDKDYVEKLLILDSGRGAKLQFVSGPYGADYMDYERTWNIWLEDVKRMSTEQ